MGSFSIQMSWHVTDHSWTPSPLRVVTRFFTTAIDITLIMSQEHRAEPMDVDAPPTDAQSMDVDQPLVNPVDEIDEQEFDSLTLPISKIKRIFKMDKDYGAASQTAVYAAGVATELFIQYFTEQAALLAKMDKRKKITYKDMAQAVASHDTLSFLSDTVPKTHPIGELIAAKKVRVGGKQEAGPLLNLDDDVATTTEDPAASTATTKAAPLAGKGQSVLSFPKTSPIKKAGISDIMG